MNVGLGLASLGGRARNTLADLRGWSPFVRLQIRYNLLDRTVERELLSMARAFDLPVLAWAPLAEGRLADKYRLGETGRLDANAASRLAHSARQQRIIETVREVAGEIGASPAGVSLAWLRQRPSNVIPIVGSSSEVQLRQNLSSIEVALKPARSTGSTA